MWYKVAMKSPLAITVLVAGLLVPLPETTIAAAASHSPSMASARVGGFARAVRVAPAPSRGRLAPARTPRSVTPKRRVAGGTGTGYYPGNACLSNPNYSGSFYCSSLFGSVFSHRQPPVFGGGTFLPYYWGVPYEPEPEPQPEAQSTVPEPENALANQVQALTDEVESLREEQEAALAPRIRRPARSEAVPEKQPTTTFVYRNGSELEADNYAILGDTLWVFGDHTTHKIPLSELDMSATEKRNEDRGVEFVPPGGGR